MTLCSPVSMVKDAMESVYIPIPIHCMLDLHAGRQCSRERCEDGEGGPPVGQLGQVRH